MRLRYGTSLLLGTLFRHVVWMLCMVYVCWGINQCQLVQPLKTRWTKPVAHTAAAQPYKRQNWCWKAAVHTPQIKVHAFPFQRIRRLGVTAITKASRNSLLLLLCAYSYTVLCLLLTLLLAYVSCMRGRQSSRALFALVTFRKRSFRFSALIVSEATVATIV